MKRKSHSIRTILFSTTTATFLLFVLATTMAATFLYVFNVSDMLTDQMNEASKQVITNYETYFENAITVSDTIQTRLSSIDVVNEKKDVSEFFDDVMMMKNEIYQISFYDLNGDLIVADSNSENTADNVKEEDFFEKALEEKLINNFSKLQYDTSHYYFTISKYVSYGNSLSGGVAKIDCDFSKIVSSIANTDLGDNGHIVVFDKEYEIIYTSYSENALDDIEILKNIILGTGIRHVKGVDYNVFVSTISNTTWKVGIFSNRDRLNSAITTFIATVISASILVSLLFAIITAYTSSKISNPLRLLKRQMTKIESLNYDMTSYTKTRGSKEVEELDESFKQMMIRIKDLANEIIVEQENQRKSELKALQNQINPHFLYNTLDSIIFMIDCGKNETAEEMITALSKFFRISISRGKTIIPFKDEIEHARNYLLIQKLRFGDQFEYIIDVEPKINDYYTIKLILQPIVENALAHGLREYQGVGKIEIIGRIEDDLIHIQVKDNGYGMLQQKVDEIYESFKDPQMHNGVGVKNVYQRLKIYYGEKADVKITSTLDIGTTVHIYIPVEGAKRNEE